MYLLDDDRALRAALARHLGSKFGDDVEIVQFARMSPGFSWLTFSFTLRRRKNDSKLILRVAPPKGLFSPYSVLPQVYALQLLANTRIPVPGLVSFAADGAEIGLPFLICEYVEGRVPAPWAASALDEDHRRRIAVQFIDILGHLHKTSWKNTPVDKLSKANDPRPELGSIAAWRGSLGRQTARYYPLLDWGGRWLEENCPVPPRVTIVHGDYRIGNFIENNQRIVAILDWELIHCGDPHEDLAWALLPTFNAGSRKLYGVIEREEVIDYYQKASGITLSQKSLAFYEAYALYQAAAIQMRAVHAFEVDGFNDMRMATMGAQMASIVRAFNRALDAAS